MHEAGKSWKGRKTGSQPAKDVNLQRCAAESVPFSFSLAPFVNSRMMDLVGRD